MSTTNFNESSVREAAYFLWLNNGQPQGQDQDHWLQAMADMTAKPAKKKAAAKPRKAAAKTASSAKPKTKAKTTAKKPAARKTAKV